MKKGYIYIILTTLIFSTMEITAKLVAKDFNPVQITFTRFLIGGLILLPFAKKALNKKKISITRRDYYFFAFLGLLGTVISMGLYQLAVQYTPASVVAVLFSSNPVFVTILAFVLLKEQIHKNSILALILEVIGIILIINPLNTKLNAVGITLSILSTLIFALYGVSGKKKCAKYGGIVVTSYSFIFGSLEFLFIILLTHINIISNAFSSCGLNVFSSIPLFKGYSYHILPIFLYICIVNTALGYVFYFKAMEVTSAQETSLVFFFKPILAPIFALIVLHETIPFNMLIGIIFILIGSLTSILPGFIAKTQTVAK